MLAETIEAIYEARYANYCRLATAVSGNVESGHDAVQEGFARALANADQFRGDGATEAWLARIVFHAALDVRRDARRLQLLPLDAAPESAASWCPELPYPDHDPELARAVRALPHQQKLVVFLRYYADLAHSEIAAIANVRRGTVSATLAQAKAALAQRLGQVELNGTEVRR